MIPYPYIHRKLIKMGEHNLYQKLHIKIHYIIIIFLDNFKTRVKIILYNHPLITIKEDNIHHL